MHVTGWKAAISLTVRAIPSCQNLFDVNINLPTAYRSNNGKVSYIPFFLLCQNRLLTDLLSMDLHCLPARCSRNVTILRALPTKVVRDNRTEARTTSHTVTVGAKSPSGGSEQIISGSLMCRVIPLAAYLDVKFFREMAQYCASLMYS